MADVWARVERGGPGACWLWTGACDQEGYGLTKMGGRMRRVTRLIMAETADVPEGLVVMHSCDNPTCCNPAHLSLGTPRDNAHDRDRKGRTCHGEQHWCAREPWRAPRKRGEDAHNARATEDKVRAIRREYAAGGVTYNQLATRHQLSWGIVARIVRRERWAHVSDDERLGTDAGVSVRGVA